MLYRYTVTPESPLRSELMSDTLFGHFCWAILYREGKGFLSDFLQSYEDHRPSPVLFSSGFLSGYVPRPSLPAPSRSELGKFVVRHYGIGNKNEFKGISQIKKWSKLRWLTLDHWDSLKTGYSDLKWYEMLFKTGDMKETKPFEIEIAASNTINRSSGMVLEGGGLFHREKQWFYPNISLDLYVEVNREEICPLVVWFLTEYLPINGFGADKSVGMGCVRIHLDPIFQPEKFDVSDANARMGLSLASFPGMESIHASYRLMTKFGKLGGTYSFSSPTGGNPRPFKKPLLMYELGAVFFSTENLNSRQLLKNVHSDPDIRHCGIPITLPFICKEALPHETQTS